MTVSSGSAADVAAGPGLAADDLGADDPGAEGFGADIWDDGDGLAEPESDIEGGLVEGAGADGASCHRLTVDASDAAADRPRLDRWLADRLPTLSRARLQALIAAGAVTVGAGERERPAKASEPAAPGLVLTVRVPAPVAARPRGQSIPLAIVFEDEAMLIVDKPAGLVVHPGAGVPDGTLVNALIHHCGSSLSGIGGERRPGIVHRLDKETSGLIAVAKTDAAHRALAQALAERRVSRVYQAIAWGRPRPSTGTVDRPIGRHPVDRLRMAVVSGGKPARTHYRVIETRGDGAKVTASLIECRLETGRTHQIRVHLAALGHPLIGDPLYGIAGRRGSAGLSPAQRRLHDMIGRQALHAVRLTLPHPIDGREITAASAPAHDFQALFQELAVCR